MCMSKKKESALKTIKPRYQTTFNNLYAQLQEAGVKKISLRDTEFQYTDLATWHRIAAELTGYMPTYTPEFFDCDDFGIVFWAECVRRWQLNGCGIAIGDTPEGRHAWNLAFTPDGFIFIEPQTGESWPLLDKSRGYICDTVEMG